MNQELTTYSQMRDMSSQELSAEMEFLFLQLMDERPLQEEDKVKFDLLSLIMYGIKGSKKNKTLDNWAFTIFAYKVLENYYPEMFVGYFTKPINDLEI